MKRMQKKPKSISQAWLAIILITTALFAGFLVWNYFIRPGKTIDQQPGNGEPAAPTESTQKSPTEPEQTPGPAKESDGKTPIQNDGDNPNTAKNITGFITSKTINPNSQQLVIRSTIDQFLQPAGTCTLTLVSAKDSLTITKTAPTISETSYSSCQGFDISLSELTAGTWRLNIAIKSGDKTGIIDGGEVNIP